jgi:hypothetical protein
MIRTLIQVLALTLTLESAFFLVKSSLTLSPKLVAELATTKWDYSPEVLKSYARQRADTLVGMGLLLVAFGLQLGNALWPMRWMDFQVSRRGAITALVISAVLLVVCLWVSRTLAQHTYNAASRIIQEQERPPLGG